MSIFHILIAVVGISMGRALPTGWRLVRVNPITQAESDTISGCPIVFRHHKLSDSSDLGPIRTQPSQNQSGSDSASEQHDKIG